MNQNPGIIGAVVANRVPNLQQHDGVPSYSFTENWYRPFRAWLGTQMDGQVNMLSVLDGTDPVAGRPARLSRLFSMLVTNVLPGSAVYETLHDPAMFPAPLNGAEAINYFVSQMQLVYTTGQVNAAKSQIKALKWESSLPKAQWMNGALLWAKVVTTQNIKLLPLANRLSEDEQSEVFLNGLHTQLQDRGATILTERPDRLIHPVNYPNNFPIAALQNQPNPNANQFNFNEVVKDINTYFTTMKTNGRFLFSDAALQAREAFVAAAGPLHTWRTYCLRCGGRGHLANECATVRDLVPRFVIIKLVNLDLTGGKGKGKGGRAAGGRGRGRGGRAFEAEEVLDEIPEEPEVPEYDPVNATQEEVDAAYAEFAAMYADADE